MEDKDLVMTNSQDTDSADGGPDASAGKKDGGQEKEEGTGKGGQTACDGENKDSGDMEAECRQEDSGKEKKGFFGKKKDPRDTQIEELTDRLKRSMAEFDNYRKRTDKEKSAMYEIGAKDVIEKILPVVDNFERGLASIPDDAKGTPFADGMEKIYKQFVKILEDMDVKPIEAVGKEFDPNFHNAVMHIEDENLGENIVAAELQKGYTYRDSVVRHSMVQVAN